MKKIMHKKVMLLTVIFTLAVTAFAGCGKEEKQFDFGKVTAIRVFTTADAQVQTILDEKQAQNLIAQIAKITWEQNTEESTREYEDWKYRIRCYNAKGEKRQNITICSESRIMYKGRFWDAEKGELDLSGYEKLFQK